MFLRQLKKIVFLLCFEVISRRAMHERALEIFLKGLATPNDSRGRADVGASLLWARSGLRFAFALVVSLVFASATCSLAFAETATSSKPSVSTGQLVERGNAAPPLSPEVFNPDPGGALPSERESESNPDDVEPAKAPTLLELYFDDPLLRPDLQVKPLTYQPEPAEGVPRLPRFGILEIIPFLKYYHYRLYKAEETKRYLPANTAAFPNRWLIPFGTWKRYMDPATETPYQYNTPDLYHPYRQSILKGDVPIYGEDIFANLTLRSFTLFEFKELPTPSGVSAALAESPEFYGRGRQILYSQDFTATIDLFKGETAFKPTEWVLHLQPVANVTVFNSQEFNQINTDPRGERYNEPSHPIDPQGLGGGGVKSGTQIPNVTNTDSSTLKPGELADALKPELRKAKGDYRNSWANTRVREFFGLQEAFGELHLADLSAAYDFAAVRLGIQPFTSDFRGFIFSDSNLGARIFGNYDSNRLQYNLAVFNMLEKDTFSGLNTFDSRDQQVIIANLYRQDFLTKGYTAEWSIHWNIDHGRDYQNDAGFVTRPAIIGDPKPHDVQAVYLGWAGDGHIGPLNITHAFYQALGQDQYNGLAGRRVFINSQMAAAEVSLDKDWIRYKLSAFYASGDHNPTDGTARGFDSILDSPNFVGGPFSWYVHQPIGLAGSALNLKTGDSLLPNFRSAKAEGQSSFVNPGVFLVGTGVDFDITPKLRSFTNINYIFLAATAPIKAALQTNHASNDFGLDMSTGFKYRPLLTENIVLAAGVGLFHPGSGYKDIYRTNTNPVPGFGSQEAGKVENLLYNVFFTVTLTY